MTKEKVVNNLIALRSNAKITQEELANFLGVTRQTIIAIEKHTYQPSISLALKIAKFFNKKVEEIFKIDEK
jgi:putative transcriptional regulator